MSWARQYYRVMKRIQDRSWALNCLDLELNGMSFDEWQGRRDINMGRLRRIESWAAARVLRTAPDPDRFAHAENLRNDADRRDEKHWNRLYGRQERFDERQPRTPD